MAPVNRFSRLRAPRFARLPSLGEAGVPFARRQKREFSDAQSDFGQSFGARQLARCPFHRRFDRQGQAMPPKRRENLKRPARLVADRGRLEQQRCLEVPHPTPSCAGNFASRANRRRFVAPVPIHRSRLGYLDKFAQHRRAGTSAGQSAASRARAGWRRVPRVNAATTTAPRHREPSPLPPSRPGCRRNDRRAQRDRGRERRIVLQTQILTEPEDRGGH